MTAQTNRQFLLAKRPVGAATRDTFTYQEVPVGNLADGQVLVRNEYLSLDPAMRGWMNEGKSYIPPVAIGEVMRALGVGQVIASNTPKFAVGDYVNGALGVQDYFLGEPRGFYKVDPKLAPLPRYLSALGMTGMTGNIVRQTTLVTEDGDNWLLHLDPQHSALFNANQQKRINDRLNQTLGRSVQLQIEVQTPAAETPALALARRRARQQADAVLSIEQDPVIQTLMTDFGARILPDSIRPLDPL